jgi:hypothetical protein
MLVKIPIIRDYFSLFTGNSSLQEGIPLVELTDEDDEKYRFRVYEDRPSHQATQGFYLVYKNDGKIINELTEEVFLPSL